MDNMITPSIGELTNEKVNRYALVIATAKCARVITDEYVRQRERAERLIANKDTDKSLASLISKEFRDEKAVRTAINRIGSGEYTILGDAVTAADVEVSSGCDCCDGAEDVTADTTDVVSEVSGEETETAAE